MDSTWIYALRERGNDEIRYVGASVNPVVRLRSHLSNGSSAAKAVSAWAKEVKKRRSEVELICLEEIPARGRRQGDRHPDVIEAENRWMVRLLDEGHDLLNVRRPESHSETAVRDRKLMQEAIERGREMFG